MIAIKIANRSFHDSACNWWNSLPIDLRHVAPTPILNSPVSLSLIFQPLFFLKVIDHLFHCSFPPKSIFT